MEKAIEVFKVIKNNAVNIASIWKTVPNVSKNRNIFKKQYNRRPMVKIKRSVAVVNTMFSTISSCIQLSAIISQPKNNI